MQHAPTLSETPPFDPRLVTLIAAGMGDPFDLAAEFGVPASEFAKLQETPAFRAALDTARQELEEQGYTPEYAELVLLQEALPGMAKDLIGRYHHASTTTDQRLKIYETLNRMVVERRNRLAPKQQAQPAGSGFSIVINIPQVGATPAKQITLEAPAREVPDTDD